jgi:hypothetical protein
VRIAAGPDARSVGTIGGVVSDRATGQPLLLGCHHVVDGGPNGVIWQPGPCGERGCACNAVGRVVRGRRSVVRWRDHWHYIDAAVAALDEDVEWTCPTEAGVGQAAEGLRVYKVGAGTGMTRGVIVDQRHVERVRVGALEVDVPNQVLIRPLPAHARFCGEGDSGALVRDEDGRVVGLHWGANAAGEGVACAIEPVLDELGVTLQAPGSGASHQREIS